MARGINKVFLIGNLGGDPEVRYIPSGSAVVNLSLATSTSWKDKQTGEQQEQTVWHRIVLFGRLAEIASQYLKKGSKIWVEGRLHYNKREWEKEGQKFSKEDAEIIVNDMQMLDSRNPHSSWENDAPKSSFSAHTDRGSASQSNTYTASSEGTGSFDDDIPF